MGSWVIGHAACGWPNNACIKSQRNKSQNDSLLTLGPVWLGDEKVERWKISRRIENI